MIKSPFPSRSIELRNALEQCGWSPDRRVADTQVQAWLRMGIDDFGCHIFPEAVRVLREFGGLTFCALDFTPEGSLERGEKLQWLLWEWKTREVLFPVAYELSGTFTFAVSSTGKVYGTGTTFLYCADSFEEFLENLILFQHGRIRWTDNTPTHWTEAMGGEVEAAYKAVYEQQP